MSNNLFVTFDVHDTARESSLILAAIEELGQAVRIFSFMWYVRSNLSASEAAERVWDVMQPEDHLIVIDASRQEVATLNLDERCTQSMMNRWHRDIREIEPNLLEPMCAIEAVLGSPRDLRAAAG